MYLRIVMVMEICVDTMQHMMSGMMTKYDLENETVKKVLNLY